MKKTIIKCDLCKKDIKEGHDRLYMITLDIGYPQQFNDGGSSPAVDRDNHSVHLHFDCSRPLFKAFPKITPPSLS